MTKQRREERPDEHAVEASLTLAWRHVHLALNAAFNYFDNKNMEDSRGGRQLLIFRFNSTATTSKAGCPSSSFFQVTAAG